jgi:aldose sugar dehydrogenase
MKLNQTSLLLIIILCVVILSISPNSPITGTISVKNSTGFGKPIILDPALNIELIHRGAIKPTDLEFIDINDILVLEKNEGTVKRIVNGEMLEKPLLDVDVANEEERGMLGMAVVKNENDGGDNDNEDGKTYVFMYYTEAEEEDGGSPIGNRLYRYELVGNELLNPKLTLDLPAEPGPYHNGGKIEIGPDGNLYVVIGDLDNVEDEEKTKTQDKELDGRGGIIRISQDGETVKPLLGDTNDDTLDKYYAYGIRNSFGMDFDPVTGNLWDTENGPTYGDEINLVEPGFNSGWNQIQGFLIAKNAQDIRELEDFSGTGKYSDPEFVWNTTSGATALRFFNSSELGEQYLNDLFVGDYHNGHLYHFDLSQNRKGLALNGALSDRKADSPEELQNIILAKGLNGITDIEVGPDGYLYVLSYWGGSIHRILPSNQALNP